MRLSSKELSRGAWATCACAFALTGALVLSGCGASGGAAGGQAQGAATEEAAEEEAPEPLTAEEVDNWIAGEDGFAGRPVTIVGQVYNVRRDEGTTLLQVNTDLEHNTGKAIILYEGANPKIGDLSYVKAVGTVADTLDYTSPYGAKLSAPCVTADTIEELTYKDAVAPTTTSLNPDAVNEQKNYTLTVDTIEFSDKETRIYLTVTNGGVGRFSIRTSSAAVVQNGVQQNTTSATIFDIPLNDYPSLSGDIVPGASMSGVLTFPPLEVGSFELWLQGSSDNVGADGGTLDFNFKFNIK